MHSHELHLAEVAVAVRVDLLPRVPERGARSGGEQRVVVLERRVEPLELVHRVEALDLAPVV